MNKKITLEFVEYQNNEKGQTILVIVFVMIIALTIGVGISNRFISTLKSSSQTYTSYRAEAVAQAAIERILLKTTEELNEFISFGSCGSDCVLNIVNDDGITETANITLSHLGNSSAPFETTLQESEVAEVTLTGYGDSQDVSICWDTPASGTPPSVVGMLIYGSPGSYSVSNFAYNSDTSTEPNGFSSTVSANGFDNCFTVNSQTNPRLMRLRSIYQDVDISVIPASGTIIPSQGILIESTGTVLTSTKKISVIKGNNIVPLPFDYVLYSTSENQNLSN